MEDIAILRQLLNGNYLEKKEIIRAKELIKILTITIKTRVV